MVYVDSLVDSSCQMTLKERQHRYPTSSGVLNTRHPRGGQQEPAHSYLTHNKTEDKLGVWD